MLPDPPKEPRSPEGSDEYGEDAWKEFGQYRDSREPSTLPLKRPKLSLEPGGHGGEPAQPGTPAAPAPGMPPMDDDAPLSLLTSEGPPAAPPEGPPAAPRHAPGENRLDDTFSELHPKQVFSGLAAKCPKCQATRDLRFLSENGSAIMSQEECKKRLTRWLATCDGNWENHKSMAKPKLLTNFASS